MQSALRFGRAAALALGAVCALALAAPAAHAVPAAAAAEKADPLVGVVNVNTASASELELLPGIGAARARALIQLREQRGGFKAVEELRDVKGIGDSGLEKLRPFVRLQGKTTAQAR